MMLESTGHVGIGTTNPRQPLDVWENAPILRLSDKNSTSVNDVGSIIEFYDRATARAGWMGFGNTADDELEGMVGTSKANI